MPDGTSVAPLLDTTIASSVARAATDPERARIAEGTADQPGRWWAFGPYVSERAWGTVREDYSADGRAWEYLPHDHARSRTYRWSEDGLAGMCDVEQRLCFALAFWNGRDPILKERIFGLTGTEGNHGEDAKEYWWYVDATPTASWLRWRYHYPHEAFPYAALLSENRRRTRADREFELQETGIFAHGYWAITADYAKATPDDICIRLKIRNAGTEEAVLHVLPTLWFRNRWSWDGTADRPVIRAISTTAAVAVAEDPVGGTWILRAGSAPDGTEPTLLFCENETNFPRFFGSAASTPYPKDGINDHVVHGAPTVNPSKTGTKMACWYRITVPAGETVELRLRLARAETTQPFPDLGPRFERVLIDREREADAFYAPLRTDGTTDEEAAVMRRGFAGLVWSQQFYHYDVERWLDGDAAQPTPPTARRRGRNAAWRHLDSNDVLVMPDKWEYPWYAAWDLGFHCVTLAHLNAAAAKHQLLLLCREWFMHPNGQLPAYEWGFGDVNPPVHAWAALRVYTIDGSRDRNFLVRIFHKLLLNFTWWVNRKETLADNVFTGGFLGLDNIGPFDRSAILPPGVVLEQADSTAWMAMFCLDLLEMALELAKQDPAYQDVAVKFFEHFANIATAMNGGGLWDEADGFYYDRLRLPDGRVVTLRTRSMVGLVPLCAALAVPHALWARLPEFRTRMEWFIAHRWREKAAGHGVIQEIGEGTDLVMLVDIPRLRRLLGTMLNEEEFLSPYGLRSLSRYHRDHPFVLVEPASGREFVLDYEPAESTAGQFGGNSNWRGPIWFPLNYLVIGALRRLHAGLGDAFTVELPTGSGRLAHLGTVADDLERRLLRLFLPDGSGRRPIWGSSALFQEDPAWRDELLFHEYFHAETGEGLGASHQTGWTALVAALVAERARS